LKAPGVNPCALKYEFLVSSLLLSNGLNLCRCNEEVWLDPLQRRIKGGGGPVVFDGLLRAFLDGEDERLAAAAAAAAAAGVKIKKGAGLAAAAAAGAAVGAVGLYKLNVAVSP
jgi:hypothetical protein